MSKLVKEIVFEPLDSPNFTSLLSIFCNLFQSSIGPCGKLKILVSAGGHSTLSSLSTRIINNIVIDHPICIFISQVMKSHLTDFKDNGHYLGVLISSLLLQILSQDMMSHSAANLFLQQMAPNLVTRIDSLKVQINFNSVNQLLPIVKSILTSKPGCCLSQKEVNCLMVKITKAFLYSITEDDVGLGEVNVICRECSGLDNFTLVSGCLYQITEDNRYPDTKCHGQLLLVLVFDIMLSNDKPPTLNQHDRVTADFEESYSFQVNTALELLEVAVELGVSIIACQKVVHPLLKLFLQRNNILLLDRMGREVTRNVISISGASPISDLAKYIGAEHLKSSLGHVNSIQQVSWGGKTFIALERDDKNVSTLLVPAMNPEAAEELKVTVQQALNSLRRLLTEPFVTPGAGCTEMIMAAGLHLSILQNHYSRKYPLPLARLQAYVRCVQMSLLSAAGLHNLSLAVDSAYFHAWNFNEDGNDLVCRCGLVNAEMVHKENESWRELEFTSSVIFDVCDEPKYITSSRITEDVIVDLFSSKCNALKMSFECCSGLLGIGMIVHKNTTE